MGGQQFDGGRQAFRHSGRIWSNIRSAVRRSARGTQAARLDDLAGNRKTPILAKPAQAFDDRLVLDLLGGAAIIADHELALVRVVSVIACDKGAHTLDFVHELVRQQEIQRAINRWRPEFAALALQSGK